MWFIFLDFFDIVDELVVYVFFWYNYFFVDFGLLFGFFDDVYFLVELLVVYDMLVFEFFVFIFVDEFKDDLDVYD